MQDFIFRFFALEETGRQPGFFGNARWREQVGVAQFVLAVAEVLHFDPAFFHQRLKAIIDATKADPQFFCKRALAEVRVVVQATQDLELEDLLEFVASIVHGDFGTLPPCRFTIGWRGHRNLGVEVAKQTPFTRRTDCGTVFGS